MSLSEKINQQRLEKLVVAESRHMSPFDVPDYWKKSRAERMEMVKKFALGGDHVVQKTVDQLAGEATQLPRAQVDESSAEKRIPRTCTQQVPREDTVAPQDVRRATQPPRPKGLHGTGDGGGAAGLSKPTGTFIPRPGGAQQTARIEGSRTGAMGFSVSPTISSEMAGGGSGVVGDGGKFIPRPGGAGNQRQVQRQDDAGPNTKVPIGQRLVEASALAPAETVVLNERGLRYTLIHSGMQKELNAFINRMWDCYRYAFDFEGNTADPLNDRDILDVAGISFSIVPGEAIYIPINHWGYGGNWGIEVLEKFRGLFESRNHLKIPFNMAYEDMVLAIHGYDLKLPIFDPFLGLNLLKTAPQATAGMLGLKVNIKERFGYDMITYDEITKREIIDGYDKAGNAKYKTVQVKFNELIPDARVLEYGGADSDWALRLAEPVMAALKEQGLYELCTEVDIPLQKCLTRMALVGWQGDEEMFEYLKAKCQPLIDKYEFAFLDDVKRQMRFPDDQPLLAPKYWRDMGNLGWRQDLEAAKKNKKFVVDHVMSDAEVKEHVAYVIELEVPNGDMFGYSVKVDPKKGKTTISARVWDEDAFFNMGSWQQLAQLWYDVLHLQSVDKRDPRGTNEEIVGKLKKQTPLSMFDSIIEWRGYSKLMSTYLIGYSSRMHPDTKRLHTTLDQVYVRTGRFSSTAPNLQNAPRSDNDPLGIRNCFVAPNVFYIHVPGDWKNEPSIYVHTDYSQIELRVFAHYSGDPNMTDAFMKDQDVHSRTAWQMYKLGEPWIHPRTREVRSPLTVEQVKDFAKDIRNYAKTINFGIIYGRQAEALAEQLEISVEEGQKLLKLYYETYPGVLSYMQDMIAFARQTGYAETMFGRRRYIPDINEHNKWKRAEAERQSFNTPVQGSASEIIKLAMIRIDQFANGDWDVLGEELLESIFAKVGKRYTEPPKWMKLTMQIHDELVTETPASKAVEAAWLIKHIMELPIDGFTIPIVAEADVAYRWGQKQGLDFEDGGTRGIVKIKAEGKSQDEADAKLQKTLAVLASDIERFKLGGIEIKTKTAVSAA